MCGFKTAPNMSPIAKSEVMQLFNEHSDFYKSRDRFISYASHLASTHPGAKLDSIAVDSADTPDLSVTHLTLPATGKAEKVITLTSGVHGPESPYGAMALESYMRNQLKDVDFSNTTVVMVHGVNPWGWVNNYRADENNNDPNRNFKGFNDSRSSESLPLVRDAVTAGTGPSTSKLGSYLASTGGLLMSILGRSAKVYGREFSEGNILGFKTALMEGIDNVTRGLAEGQNIDPRAPLFMGEEELPQIVKIRQDVLKPAYKDAKYIFHGDFHTGLGKSGRLYYMGMSNQPKAEGKLLEGLKGSRVIYQPLAEQLYDTSGVDFTRNSHLVAPEGARVDTATLEVGGFDPDLLPFGMDGDSILAQLRTAHRLRTRGQLHHYPDSVSQERSAEIHELYTDLFNPPDRKWRMGAFEDTSLLLTHLMKKIRHDI